jgi:hypothetical protein
VDLPIRGVEDYEKYPGELIWDYAWQIASGQGHPAADGSLINPAPKTFNPATVALALNPTNDRDMHQV